MPIVLIVDDDNNFLLSLVDGLKAHDPELEIKSASNGRMALQMLSDEYVDLVITDLKMPVMDGFELLAHMSSHYPRIPVIVMTAYGTPVVENSISHLGAIHYLEKPLDFDLLLENIYKCVQTDQSDFIPGIPLIQYFKLVQMEKKSCILTIRNENQEGKMFFKKGVLLDATTGDYSGESAVMEILSWSQAEIQINSKSFNIEKHIQNDLDFIIMVFESRQRRQRPEQAAKMSSANAYDNELGGIFDVGGIAQGSVSSELQTQTLSPACALLEEIPNEEPCMTVDAAPIIEASGRPDIEAHESCREDLSIHEEETSISTALSGGKRDRLPATSEEEKEMASISVDLTSISHMLPEETLPETTIDAADNAVLFSERTDIPVVPEICGERETIFFEGKEKTVNVKKMNEALDTLKEAAGPGLLACDIYMTRDGQSIVGYNSNATYCAMSNQITQYMMNTIKEAGFPPMGGTYIIDLEGDKMVVCMILGEFQWGIIIDTQKTSLGILLNVALPRAKKAFEAALVN